MIAVGVVLVICSVLAVIFQESIVEFIASPISLGGWILIWGDNGPPNFLDSTLWQATIVLVFCFAVGSIIGLIVGKLRKLAFK